VLGLILVIMVTDFAFDGFRFALLAGTDAGIAHERTGPGPDRPWRRPSAGCRRLRCTWATY
jgi:hypothetical protein